MGESALLILELAGGQDLLGKRLHRERGLLAPAHGALGLFLSFAGIFEEVLSILLVHHVQDGSAGNQQDHQHNVPLHDRSRNEGR